MASLKRSSRKKSSRKKAVAGDGTSSEILTMSSVRKSFETEAGEQRALQSVSFTVSRGEFVFITGVTGCGKSTALKLLHGQLRPDSGSITLGGVDVSKLDQKAYRRKVGYVSQNFDVLARMTVAENIAYPLETLRQHPTLIRHRVEELLQVFDLHHARDRLSDDSLSGGERQRLAVARAIAHRPDLLLCDEPTGNLDAATTFGVMRTLNRVSMIGTTVICVTHDPQIVDLMSKRVITINEGVVASDQVGGYRLY
jgi:cell division transport system ATP-binding protein